MKGIIVAAGYGTRFLPVTKTIPKEMLPLLEKPSIAFIVEEFIDSGIEDIIIITSRRKKSLEDYFDKEAELESVFAAQNAKSKLSKITPYDANFIFLRQREMRGTGHALLQTAPLIGNEPVIVAYPDDIHFGNPPLSQQLIEVNRKTGASVLATIYDPPEINSYAALKIDSDGQHVVDMVEKPEPGKEPSKEASIGRYLYTPEFFHALKTGWQAHQKQNSNGEYHHVPALKELMPQKKVVYHRLSGNRFDTGTPAGFLECLLHYCAGREDMRGELLRIIPQLNLELS